MIGDLMTLETATERSDFGSLADGTQVEAVELSNRNGVSVRILTLGATLQSLNVPDRNGQSADVVLGYPDATSYLSQLQYFGSTIGRYANRIAEGRFELDGKSYQLEINSGANHSHGGRRGFDKVIWSIESISNSDDESSVVLAHNSPDGDGGYPGALEVIAIYTLNDQNELTIEFSATSDRPTIVNMTNHSYFNLAGEASTRDILSHMLTLYSESFTPVDKDLIPTGELRNVAGTPFDFREPSLVGEHIGDIENQQIAIGHGYDHNFAISGPLDSLRKAARLEDPQSGRVMEMYTNAPGVQFYSGNFVGGSGKSGRTYRPRDALCLEPQAYPDAPNQSAFPSARLNPGETYRHTMVLKFSTVDRGD
jgi:aldose 1-epimerase